MTGILSSASRQSVGLVVLGLGAFALRVFPFLGPEGALGWRVDYDEGVYFSAASYLLEGVLPWRDFVFVHPPGQLYFLALTSAWAHSFLGVAGAFALSRWLAALLGVASTLLVVKIARQWHGPSWAPLLAGAFYASYAEVVQVERGPFLEPLLNLVCLALVWVVLTASASGAQPSARGRLLTLAGVLSGLAVGIKLWAGTYALGALWALSGFATRKEVAQFVVVAALTACALILPLAVMAPEAFVTQVGLFHAWRPPDGVIFRIERIGHIVSPRHLASPVLALITAVRLTTSRRWNSLARLAVGPWLLTLLAFFASSAWWSQYNAHLIASEALVAAGAFSLLSPKWLKVALAMSVVSALGSVGFTVQRGLPVPDEHLALAHSALRDSPDCVFTFEPGWALSAGRLPPRQTGPLIDSYATELLQALQNHQRFENTSSAFATLPGPPNSLISCKYLVLGDRGSRQVSLDALAVTHERTLVDGLEVWVRR